MIETRQDAGRARAGVMTRRGLLKAMAAGAATVVLPPPLRADAERPPRPNILFIMADDHAANAISCFGSRLAKAAPTPNLDRLASEGARVERMFCTNSICVPSRASILTGLYGHRSGVYRLSDKLDPKARNVAKLLRAGGYETAVIGKWHLKAEPAGFDHWRVLEGQGRYRNPKLKGPEGKKVHEGYCTDVITDLAIDWLKGRSSGRPFLLLCHYKAAHEPWHYAKRHASLYRDTVFPEPASLFEDQSHRSAATRDKGYTMETMAGRMVRPGHVPERFDASGLDDRQRRRKAYQHFLRAYLRCIAGIDENVGRLMKTLKRQGLADNTVVIYTSDQGYFLGEHNYIDKRWMFEESLQMATIVRYPKEIKGGTVNRDILINTDFAPLMLDFAGLSVPADMQGRSFRANLAGRTPAGWREAMYYHYWTHQQLRPAHYGIRTKRYKLMHFYGNAAEGGPDRDAWELYDLEKDPREVHNVYADPAYAETVKDLRKQLDGLRREVGDTRAVRPGGASKPRKATQKPRRQR